LNLFVFIIDDDARGAIEFSETDLPKSGSGKILKKN